MRPAEASGGGEGLVGEGEVIAEILEHGERVLLQHGGRGGRGNASFKTGDNNAPLICEHGERAAPGERQPLARHGAA